MVYILKSMPGMYCHDAKRDVISRGASEAYMLDEVNARLYKVSADGTSVEIPPVKKRKEPTSATGSWVNTGP
jgi:hypothetical protein